MNSRTREAALKAWLPSRRWLFLPPVLLGAGVVAWLVTEKRELPRVQPKSKLLVHAIRMERSQVFAEATGFGTAQAKRTWTATAEVGGRVEAAHAVLRNGVGVAPDQLLLSIDPEDYRLRMKQRKAEVVQAQAELDRMRVQSMADEESLKLQTQLLDVRNNEVRRMEKLRSGLASSEAELDSATANWLLQAQSVQNLESTVATNAARIASAEASLAISEANLKSAERDLERTQIRAPFRGILTGVSLEETQYVAPNQQLFQVIDNTTVEITAQFSLAQLRDLVAESFQSTSRKLPMNQNHERFVSQPISLGEPESPRTTENWFNKLNASVAVRSGSFEQRFPARVQRLTGVVDEQTRTLGIVVQVENEDASTPFTLTPGTYCEVLLRSPQPTLAHLIPRESLEGETVFVVDEEGRLARRTVDIAFAKEEAVAVWDGIRDGELLVLNPSARLRSGKRVDVQVVESPIRRLSNVEERHTVVADRSVLSDSFMPATGVAQ